MRGDGAFLLAWHLRTEGKHQRALEQLDQLLEQGPQEHDEDIVGRAAYWRARTLAELGRKEQAREAHAELARTAPLAYYAQQSIARLDELAPERAAAVRERMRQQEPLAPLTFPKRAEMQQAGFTRALELLRVGATHLALDEFDHLGLTGEGADRDLRWLTAALLDRAGAHPEASRMVRRQLPSFRETMPTGRARHLWRLAYPKAFSPLIEEVAKQRGVPASFVRAVAREESGFDPRAVSIAHAYGLIQLIKPTAKRFARTLGLPSDPASLKTPKINLQIGTRYIEYLWKRFDNPAVVPAAYNAGGGAAHGWIEKRGHLPLDAWIEEIPYDETRRYTRRVLQTYGIYSWLDSGQLPPLRAQL
jgi:soluble lytic murein transglycosylase